MPPALRDRRWMLHAQVKTKNNSAQRRRKKTRIISQKKVRSRELQFKVKAKKSRKLIVNGIGVVNTWPLQNNRILLGILEGLIDGVIDGVHAKSVTQRKMGHLSTEMNFIYANVCETCWPLTATNMWLKVHRINTSNCTRPKRKVSCTIFRLHNFWVA